ncbi:tubulin--tyrosine ligase, putative [Plasmodium knowlesi strain H]|uniref:Tubulin--tyrosine ligase, putative n=3 Tax=Plasmodium knowlesi TaxID=5850 RepID=A0A5K1V1T1_PLAKH|nr:tubulin--tyrosine ligase, putative [Plasmodium knowlesi strain H]OTN65105.1 putative Tubulin--tyrosine ligase [Plasmodium knowlesi]CAA9988493.1 tubulin--tyrosine ligase, putative [Plasmodium knowlesi strain H]SBO19711.1 tubulin--tyrosine ligase, putative [Plasmodium knowlesi strain H]SBO20498.1 tubulin--tyrosine ligase, putative [Plasmodium knowlesi strain H]VVS77967.1 tubulin--tyrosine ligase, putative [Plasmodium knowlesi strain H]|eukprot:XP_002259472.1 Tubulin-tyrosine ligase, putative [Plasmodium knowlesi strain H]
MNTFSKLFSNAYNSAHNNEAKECKKGNVSKVGVTHTLLKTAPNQYTQWNNVNIGTKKNVDIGEVVIRNIKKEEPVLLPHRAHKLVGFSNGSASRQVCKQSSSFSVQTKSNSFSRNGKNVNNSAYSLYNPHNLFNAYRLKNTYYHQQNALLKYEPNYPDYAVQKGKSNKTAQDGKIILKQKLYPPKDYIPHADININDYYKQRKGGYFDHNDNKNSGKYSNLILRSNAYPNCGLQGNLKNYVNFHPLELSTKNEALRSDNSYGNGKIGRSLSHMNRNENEKKNHLIEMGRKNVGQEGMPNKAMGGSLMDLLNSTKLGHPPDGNSSKNSRNGNHVISDIISTPGGPLHRNAHPMTHLTPNGSGTPLNEKQYWKKPNENFFSRTYSLKSISNKSVSNSKGTENQFNSSSLISNEKRMGEKPIPKATPPEKVIHEVNLQRNGGKNRCVMQIANGSKHAEGELKANMNICELGNGSTLNLQQNRFTNRFDDPCVVQRSNVFICSSKNGKSYNGSYGNFFVPQKNNQFRGAWSNNQRDNNQRDNNQRDNNQPDGSQRGKNNPLTISTKESITYKNGRAPRLYVANKEAKDREERSHNALKYVQPESGYRKNAPMDDNNEGHNFTLRNNFNQRSCNFVSPIGYYTTQEDEAGNEHSSIAQNAMQKFTNEELQKYYALKGKILQNWNHNGSACTKDINGVRNDSTGNEGADHVMLSKGVSRIRNCYIDEPSSARVNDSSEVTVSKIVKRINPDDNVNVISGKCVKKTAAETDHRNHHGNYNGGGKTDKQCNNNVITYAPSGGTARGPEKASMSEMVINEKCKSRMAEKIYPQSSYYVSESNDRSGKDDNKASVYDALSGNTGNYFSTTTKFTGLNRTQERATPEGVTGESKKLALKGEQVKSNTVMMDSNKDLSSISRGINSSEGGDGDIIHFDENGNGLISTEKGKINFNVPSEDTYLREAQQGESSMCCDKKDTSDIFPKVDGTVFDKEEAKEKISEAAEEDDQKEKAYLCSRNGGLPISSVKRCTLTKTGTTDRSRGTPILQRKKACWPSVGSTEQNPAEEEDETAFKIDDYSNINHVKNNDNSGDNNGEDNKLSSHPKNEGENEEGVEGYVHGNINNRQSCASPCKRWEEENSIDVEKAHLDAHNGQNYEGTWWSAPKPSSILGGAKEISQMDKRNSRGKCHLYEVVAPEYSADGNDYQSTNAENIQWSKEKRGKHILNKNIKELKKGVMKKYSLENLTDSYIYHLNNLNRNAKMRSGKGKLKMNIHTSTVLEKNVPCVSSPERDNMNKDCVGDENERGKGTKKEEEEHYMRDGKTGEIKCTESVVSNGKMNNPICNELSFQKRNCSNNVGHCELHLKESSHSEYMNLIGKENQKDSHLQVGDMERKDLLSYFRGSILQEGHLNGVAERIIDGVRSNDGTLDKTVNGMNDGVGRRSSGVSGMSDIICENDGSREPSDEGDRVTHARKVALPWKKDHIVKVNYRSRSMKGKGNITINTKLARYERVLIHTCISKLNWKKCIDNANKGTFYWIGYNITDFEHYNYMKKKKIINRIPSMYMYTKKKALTFLLSHLSLIFPSLYDFYPNTFVLPENKNIIKYILNGNNKDYYIMKPDCGSMGMGVKVIHKYSDININILNGYNCYIVQKYIDNPLLMYKKKFDFRIYILLLPGKHYPKIYLSKIGFARLCTEEYKKKKRYIYNTFIHLTNYSINKDNEKYIRKKNIHDKNNNKQLLSDVFIYLKNNGYDIDDIWKQIKKITCLTSLAIYSYIKEKIKYNFNNNFYFYQLIGLDILLDDTGKAWLLEVNSNPSLRIDYIDQSNTNFEIQLESMFDRYVKEPVISEMFLIVYRKIYKKYLWRRGKRGTPGGVNIGEDQMGKAGKAGKADKAGIAGKADKAGIASKGGKFVKVGKVGRTDRIGKVKVQNGFTHDTFVPVNIRNVKNGGAHKKKVVKKGSAKGEPSDTYLAKENLKSDIACNNKIDKKRGFTRNSGVGKVLSGGGKFYPEKGCTDDLPRNDQCELINKCKLSDAQTRKMGSNAQVMNKVIKGKGKTKNGLLLKKENMSIVDTCVDENDIGSFSLSNEMDNEAEGGSIQLESNNNKGIQDGYPTRATKQIGEESSPKGEITSNEMRAEIGHNGKYFNRPPNISIGYLKGIMQRTHGGDAQGGDNSQREATNVNREYRNEEVVNYDEGEGSFSNDERLYTSSDMDYEDSEVQNGGYGKSNTVEGTERGSRSTYAYDCYSSGGSSDGSVKYVDRNFVNRLGVKQNGVLSAKSNKGGRLQYSRKEGKVDSHGEEMNQMCSYEELVKKENKLIEKNILNKETYVQIDNQEDIQFDRFLNDDVETYKTLSRNISDSVYKKKIENFIMIRSNLYKYMNCLNVLGIRYINNNDINNFEELYNKNISFDLKKTYTKIRKDILHPLKNNVLEKNVYINLKKETSKYYNEMKIYNDCYFLFDFVLKKYDKNLKKNNKKVEYHIDKNTFLCMCADVKINKIIENVDIPTSSYNNLFEINKNTQENQVFQIIKEVLKNKNYEHKGNSGMHTKRHVSDENCSNNSSCAGPTNLSNEILSEDRVYRCTGKGDNTDNECSTGRQNRCKEQLGNGSYYASIFCPFSLVPTSNNLVNFNNIGIGGTKYKSRRRKKMNIYDLEYLFMRQVFFSKYINKNQGLTVIDFFLLMQQVALLIFPFISYVSAYNVSYPYNGALFDELSNQGNNLFANGGEDIGMGSMKKYLKSKRKGEKDGYNGAYLKRENKDGNACNDLVNSAKKDVNIFHQKGGEVPYNHLHSELSRTNCTRNGIHQVEEKKKNNYLWHKNVCTNVYNLYEYIQIGVNPAVKNVCLETFLNFIFNKYGIIQFS